MLRFLNHLTTFLQDEIFGSAYASAAYLKYNLKFPKDKKVYVIGEDGLEHELKAEGIQYAGGTVCSATPSSETHADVALEDPNDNQFFPSMDFVGFEPTAVRAGKTV